MTESWFSAAPVCSWSEIADSIKYADALILKGFSDYIKLPAHLSSSRKRRNWTRRKDGREPCRERQTKTNTNSPGNSMAM